MGLPILGDAIASLQFFWDASPTPVKVLLSIALVTVLVAGLSAAVGTFDQISGQHIKSILTIGATFATPSGEGGGSAGEINGTGGGRNDCRATAFPQCKINSFVQQRIDLAYACINIASNLDPQCKIKYFGKLNGINGTPPAIWFFEQYPYDQSKVENQLIHGSGMCTSAIIYCNADFQRVISTSLLDTYGIDCSNFASNESYYSQLAKWENNDLCEGSTPGIYLLDAKLWAFGSLLFYAIVIVLQYYGSTWKQ